MVEARRLGRLGIFAVGLGIGAAMAYTSGIASADSTSGDIASVLTAIDPFSAAATPVNIDISFDGYTLFQGYDSTAVAATGTAGNGGFDLAIAMGAGAHATATGGMFDYASADGTNAEAVAGGVSGDSAIDIGNNSATSGNGLGIVQGAFAEGGKDNTAIDVGNNSGTGMEGSFAGGGGILAGNGFGDNTGAYDEALTFANLGTGAGATTTGLSGAYALDGNNDSASIFSLGSGAADTNAVIAAEGNRDLASVFGTTSRAYAGGDNSVLGNNNVAEVVNSDGAAGSSAVAGSGFVNGVLTSGNSDVARVVGDGYHAVATGGNNLVDLLPSSLGDSTTAATSAATDLSGLAADFSSFLTDIESFFTF